MEWTNPSELSPQTYTFVKFVKTGSQESLNWTFSKIQCMHCVEPHCVAACPTTALIKTEDGPVIYRKELCIGCAYCVNACPFDVPKFDEENKVIEKCTFCNERIKENLEPACVQACPTDTLVLMSLEEAKRKATEAENQGNYTYGLHEVGGTSWVYISAVPFSELGFSSHTNATPSAHQTGLLTRFAGIGILGGALYSAMRIYSQRKEEVTESQGGD
jgi:formate dehydrogenase iron-sulfur subunit